MTSQKKKGALPDQKPDGMQFRWWCWLHTVEKEKPGEYILWLRKQLAKWKAETGTKTITENALQGFDEWLGKKILGAKEGNNDSD